MDAKIIVDAAERIGTASPLLFGSMLENWGSAERPKDPRNGIYGSLWVGEDSTIANLKGLRADVLKASKDLNPSIIRWPGGCPADVYHWLDGVGPPEERPVSLLAGHYGTDEPHTFGTHEFVTFCRQVGAEPYLNVNVGSGTPEEAANWVEYCNSPPTTRYAAMRAADGHPEPFYVKYWGIGNELFLPGEVGYMDAKTHARTVFEYAKIMRMVDPEIKIVAVGCGLDEWNRALLEAAGNAIDYLSIHKYYFVDEYYALLACPLETERSIVRLGNLIDGIQVEEKKGSFASAKGGKTKIALDEWNVWHKYDGHSGPYRCLTLADGLFAAGMFHAMHRCCNHLGMANLCNLVNSDPCGAIVTSQESMYVNPLYLAFDLYRHHTGNVVLRAHTEVPSYTAGDTRVEPWPEPETLGPVPYLDCLATLDESQGCLRLAVINRHKASDIHCVIALGGLTVGGAGKVSQLNGDAVDAANDFDSPNNVAVTETVLRSTRMPMEFLFPCHSASILEIPASIP